MSGTMFTPEGQKPSIERSVTALDNEIPGAFPAATPSNQLDTPDLEAALPQTQTRDIAPASETPAFAAFSAPPTSSHFADGLVLTQSGRRTYAPDGHVDNVAFLHEEAGVQREVEEEGSFEDDSEVTPTMHGSEDGEKDRTFAAINPGDHQELTRIASTMPSRVSTSDTLTRINTNDPSLDPASKDFDLRKWLRVFMRNLDNEDVKQKRAGVVFKNLAVSGSGAALQLQQTLGGLFTSILRIGSIFKGGEPKQILRNFNGTLKSGELLIVLGRPGSGCSTFLKSLCGEHHGLTMDKGSDVHYNGIPQQTMMKEFKGEVIYNQEVDKHFPHLTVGQTLEFAASARTPSHRIQGMSRSEYAKNIAKVVMAVFGLSHTYNTKVGSDFVRGVSGGERKRVSIAEMALAAAPFAAWDNSTRGLDSATAFKFVRSLRLLADLAGSTHAVAIYQASQAIYDEFDKAIVLYEGRMIYYGPANKGKQYFEQMGWYCPPRQTTGDFLTSVTNPGERQARDGMEKKVPRTPDDFEAYWLQSQNFQAVQQEIAGHEQDFPPNNESAITELRAAKNEAQADHTRKQSPFLISIPMQIKLNTKRAYQRMWNDIASPATTVLSNIIMALIIGSVFYNSPTNTNGFFAKGAVLFFAVLLNALTAMSEINSLYAQRPIVEKHMSYAFYHPATEAIAGIMADIPIKFCLAVAFNVIVYFLSGLRREPSQFFIYFLVVFMIMFIMAAVFRTMASITKTVDQAMALSGILILALVIYTGFVLPTPYMKDWFKWIHYINPIYYAFEMLVANEFHGQNFPCAVLVPTVYTGDSFACSTTGGLPGEDFVSGDRYIALSYEYYYSHVWRNFGILCAFLFGFMFIYFIATEVNSSTTSTAEVLVFRRGHVPASITKSDAANDEEKAADGVATKEGGESEGVNAIPPQTDIFTWRNLIYDIKIKGEPRRLLDNVAGYVKPGTLTALMGVSGAGKTTLLDVLAHRTTMGVITGDMFVNGKPLDPSFQRSTGYVQQQDLHLATATVRESLQFSAMLRQPKSVSKADKYAYVEEVIKMLDMEDFAEAVVGTPGEGLNVEQRKLLTIGVELAAKPKLLVFLDEPTSGLDSQSAWAICAFLRKLANAGQAVLCTIHQPSAILFQEFDRLLFLAKGGKTVYFGPIGKQSRTLLDYFEGNGSRKCGDEENPAEFMLEIVNAGSSGQGQDWHEVWKASDECQDVQRQIDQIHQDMADKVAEDDGDAAAHAEFAMPLSTQVKVVTHRVFQQYWRMPTYIIAKWFLGMVAGLFIGFSFFQANTSTQGIQNEIFSTFMCIAIFSSLVQQVMPLFVTQRALYEVRERPSKAYSWKAFMFANIVVEIPYNLILGVIVFGCYHYAVAGIQSSERQGLVLLFYVSLYMYAGTFAHLCIAALPDAQTAAAVVTLLFSMSLTFCGVLQAPSALPGFWIFMYRVSPFTYLVSGVVSTQIHGRHIDCSDAEVTTFSPPTGQTCGAYLADYLTEAPGYLLDATSTTTCQYCPYTVADQIVANDGIEWSTRWRNYGILWAYLLFNICAAILLYYLFRVRKFSIGGLLAPLKKAPAMGTKDKPVAKNAEGEKQINTAQPV